MNIITRCSRTPWLRYWGRRAEGSLPMSTTFSPSTRDSSPSCIPGCRHGHRSLISETSSLGWSVHRFFTHNTQHTHTYTHTHTLFQHAHIDSLRMPAHTHTHTHTHTPTHPRTLPPPFTGSISHPHTLTPSPSSPSHTGVCTRYTAVTTTRQKCCSTKRRRKKNLNNK